MVQNDGTIMSHVYTLKSTVGQPGPFYMQHMEYHPLGTTLLAKLPAVA